MGPQLLKRNNAATAAGAVWGFVSLERPPAGKSRSEQQQHWVLWGWGIVSCLKAGWTNAFTDEQCFPSMMPFGTTSGTTFCCWTSLADQRFPELCMLVGCVTKLYCSCVCLIVCKWVYSKHLFC